MQVIRDHGGAAWQDRDLQCCIAAAVHSKCSEAWQGCSSLITWFCLPACLNVLLPHGLEDCGVTLSSGARHSM
jgi:hypothetical protein